MYLRGAFPVERSHRRMILRSFGQLLCLRGHRNCAQGHGNRRQEEGPRLSCPESSKHKQPLHTGALFARLAGRMVCCLSPCTVTWVAEGKVSEQTSKTPTKMNVGLKQKGAEGSAGWPKAVLAFMQDCQSWHVQDTNDCICTMAVQRRQNRAALRCLLLYQRCCCLRRRTAADQPGNLWARPDGNVRAACFRHHRALGTATLHRVHPLVAGSRHGERRHCRKNNEQRRNEFDESSHASVSEIIKTGISPL
jgi:hypothetical protein